MAVSGYPEVKKVEMSPDLDFIICACDGIWDCMTSQEACNYVQSAKKKLETFTPEQRLMYKKKPSLKDPPKAKGKVAKGEKKMEDSINASKFHGLATVVEMMMDRNCA